MPVRPLVPALPGDAWEGAGAQPFGPYAPFRKALIKVLAEKAADGSGTRLEALARMVVAQAEAGDREALRDVVDRIDGKPFPNDGPERPKQHVVFGWRDAFEPPVRAAEALPRRLVGN
jgi:hypothetical protein